MFMADWEDLADWAQAKEARPTTPLSAAAEEACPGEPLRAVAEEARPTGPSLSLSAAAEIQQVEEPSTTQQQVGADSMVP